MNMKKLLKRNEFYVILIIVKLLLTPPKIYTMYGLPNKRKKVEKCQSRRVDFPLAFLIMFFH